MLGVLRVFGKALVISGMAFSLYAGWRWWAGEIADAKALVGPPWLLALAGPLQLLAGISLVWACGPDDERPPAA